MPPYPTDPSRYPPEYGMLFARAMDKRVEINLGDSKLATRTRHQLHAYRRACEDSKQPGWTLLRSVVVRTEGSKLVLEPNEAVAMIRNSTGSTQGVPAEKPQHNAEPAPDALDEYIRKSFGTSEDEQS